MPGHGAALLIVGQVAPGTLLECSLGLFHVSTNLPLLALSNRVIVGFYLGANLIDLLAHLTRLTSRSEPRPAPRVSLCSLYR